MAEAIGISSANDCREYGDNDEWRESVTGLVGDVKGVVGGDFGEDLSDDA